MAETMVTRICNHCGIIFEAKLAYVKVGRMKFCSTQCKKQSQIGTKQSEECCTKRSLALMGNQNSKGNIGWMLGKHHTNETKKKLSEARKGKGYPNPMLGKHHPEETIKKISNSIKSSFLNGRKPWNFGWKGYSTSLRGRERSEEHCRRLSEALKGRPGSNKGKPGLAGERNGNWRGGISFEPYCQKFNKRLKERIRERDNRTCQLCGENENGKKLHVHHIHYDKPNCNPDLISLCACCHAKANGKRDYWETYFMQKLTEGGLLSS